VRLLRPSEKSVEAEEEVGWVCRKVSGELGLIRSSVKQEEPRLRSWALEAI
jgi:hypothetical protein